MQFGAQAETTHVSPETNQPNSGSDPLSEVAGALPLRVADLHAGLDDGAVQVGLHRILRLRERGFTHSCSPILLLKVSDRL